MGLYKSESGILGYRSVIRIPQAIKLTLVQVYNGDRFHLMPIITPAYPSMCSTHNITMSTKKIIIRELERGGDIVDKIFTGQLQWKDLFSRHTFFTQGYKYYLSIIAASRSKEAQLVWSGLVESKVRLLVSQLETQGSIEIAHPFNKGFDRVHHCGNEDEVEAVSNGELQFQAKNTKTEPTDLTKDPKHDAAANGDAENIVVPNGHSEVQLNGEEKHVIYTTTYYIGIELAQGRLAASIQPESSNILADGTKKLDISYQTKHFKELCTEWAQYSPEMNSLNIVHTRK